MKLTDGRLAEEICLLAAAVGKLDLNRGFTRPLRGFKLAKQAHLFDCIVAGPAVAQGRRSRVEDALIQKSLAADFRNIYGVRVEPL